MTAAHFPNRILAGRAAATGPSGFRTFFGRRQALHLVYD
jgi:hypothetical protein